MTTQWQTYTRWFDVRFISSRKAEELRRSSVRIGDILIVKIGSIGYSAILDDLNGFDHAIIPANLAKVTPNLSKVDLRYLHRWLTSTAANAYLLRAASKTAQPALSLGKIKGLPVPLPPLAEQKRIARILDAADALRAKRREALAQLDALARSTFLDMFGDPVTNPMGWDVRSLDEVAAPVQNAIVDGPFGSNLKVVDYVPVGVPVLQGKNITNNTFRWFDVRFISSRKAEKLKRSSVRIGDILIVKIGSIGYSAILDDLNGFDHAIIPANLAKITPNLSKVDLRYLHGWLTSPEAIDYLLRVASKTA